MGTLCLFNKDIPLFFRPFMQTLKIFSLFAAMLCSTIGFAKGHGGGHGGGHSGGHHSSARSSGGHTSPYGNTAKSAKNPAKRISTAASRRSRTTGANTRTRYVQLPASASYRVPVTTVYEPWHPGYSPYYNGFGYGYPYVNYYWYDMLWLRMSLGYTPNYGYLPPEYNGYGSGSYNNPGGTVEEDLEGFVVYARDTLRGQITLKSKSIFLEKTDSGHQYDYKFRPGQEMLTAVRVINEDDKQLDLVRLNYDPKKLWRLIHDGKLNLYDTRHSFIYQPEDIDIRTLVAVYNGNVTELSGSGPEETKENLTNLVNTAYGTNLNAAKFTWRELLIYVDKLDTR